MMKQYFSRNVWLLWLVPILLLSNLQILAGHTFHVPSAIVCLDGARFSGSAGGAASLNLPMTGRIMDLGGVHLAVGGTHTFTTVGEKYNFTVNYPNGTLTAGSSVRASVSDTTSAYGTNGDAIVVTVGDCLLDPVVLDERINRFDSAAPFAVYAIDGGLDFYLIDASSEGNLVLSVTSDEINAIGIPAETTVIASQSGIVLSRYPDGQFLVVAPTSNGKTYVLIFESVGNLTTYTSYEMD